MIVANVGLFSGPGLQHWVIIAYTWGGVEGLGDSSRPPAVTNCITSWLPLPGYGFKQIIWLKFDNCFEIIYTIYPIDMTSQSKTPKLQTIEKINFEILRFNHKVDAYRLF